MQLPFTDLNVGWQIRQVIESTLNVEHSELPANMQLFMVFSSNPFEQAIHLAGEEHCEHPFGQIEICGWTITMKKTIM